MAKIKVQYAKLIKKALLYIDVHYTLHITNCTRKKNDNLIIIIFSLNEMWCF